MSKQQRQRALDADEIGGRRPIRTNKTFEVKDRDYETRRKPPSVARNSRQPYRP